MARREPRFGGPSRRERKDEKFLRENAESAPNMTEN
jgi:hypothetical protein